MYSMAAECLVNLKLPGMSFRDAFRLRLRGRTTCGALGATFPCKRRNRPMQAAGKAVGRRAPLGLRPISLEIAGNPHAQQRRPPQALMLPSPLVLPSQPRPTLSVAGGAAAPAGAPAATPKPTSLHILRTPLSFDFTNLPTVAANKARTPSPPRSVRGARIPTRSAVRTAPGGMPLGASGEGGEEFRPLLHPSGPWFDDLPAAPLPGDAAARLLEQRRVLRPAVRQRIKSNQRQSRWLEPPPPNENAALAILAPSARA